MRITFGIIWILTVMLASAVSVSAQPATPTQGPGEHSFEDLDLPELRVTATEQGLETVSEIPSGPVVLVLDNRTAAPTMVSPMQVAPGDVPGDLKLPGLNLPALPPAFHRATWAGGTSAMPGASTSVIVTLAPGQWYLYSWDSPTPDPEPLTVTRNGSGTADFTIDAVNTIEMRDFQFVLPSRIEAGADVWKITNTGEQIHDIHILAVPAGTTPETVKHVFFPDAGATPPPNLPDPDAFVPYAGFAPLSHGQSFWTDITFEAGTYMMVTWFAERESGALQLTLGMLTVFEVVEPGTTGFPPASPASLMID